MNGMRVLGLRLTRGVAVLILLGAMGLGLIAYRFLWGLGAVTNLSDGYPWGFWIGIDILVGIALAAGGFVMAGLVHILGGRKFHPLARPAILTALLGYLLFIFALSVDLGRPWHIWKALISWNHVSPMFEVAWCVMFYTFVLMLEFTPVVLERLRLERALATWRQLAPLAVLAALTLFVFAMTDSVRWAAITFSILLIWEISMRVGWMPRDKEMPVLLIMAGIMLSTLHQSSLGTLFLITDKLSPLWYTPILPALFFLSALMVAPAMVIFEATVTGHVLNHGPEMQLLEPLGRAMPFLIGGYLIVRLADVMLRGVMWAALTPSLDSAWWWLEMVALLAAQAYFLSPEARARSRSLFVAALATVVAVVVHRTGVAIVGIEVPEYAPYVPAWPEVMITVGIAALGLLAFRVAAEHLPVYERVEVRETVRERGRPEAVRQPAYVADADARW
jgi:formate dehydrogenase iron-sulfur subunit